MMLAGGILKRRGCPMTPAAIDETHAPQAESWLSDANGHPDFPVQNLPLGIFSEVGGTARGGVAIGDHIIDLAAIVSLLNGEAKQAAVADSGPTLKPLLELGAGTRRALRRGLFARLKAYANADKVRHALYQTADGNRHLP